MIDPAGLRALVAVERSGSVAAAAELLGYTPSAVSQQVKKLERGLGAPLLERRGRGVLLTERGRALAIDGRAVLDGLERLESVATADDRAVPLRIASFSTATRGLVAGILADLADGAATSSSVRSVDPFEAVELVDDGRVDLGVVHDWNSVPLSMPAHLVAEHLCWDEADVVLSAEHPLSQQVSIERADLISEAWASTPRGAICHEALQRIFADLGAVPRIVAEDPDFASLVELARAGAAIALVPRLGRAPLPEGVVARPLADRSQVRQVRAIYRRTRAHRPALQRAVAMLVAAASRLRPSDEPPVPTDADAVAATTVAAAAAATTVGRRA